MKNEGFLPAVQGLRGLASISVLFVHLYDMPLLAKFLPDVPPWFEAGVNMCGHGVELFFMISGFLIPASLVRHASVGKFFYDRCLRILPVFVVLHLVLFALGPVVGYKFFRDIDFVDYIRIFVANLFFVPDVFGLPTGQQNAWTLTYEWGFYIWFAAVFTFVTRRAWPLVAALLAIGLATLWLSPISAFFGVGMILSYYGIRWPLAGLPGALAGAFFLVAMYVSLQYIHPFIGLIPGFALFAMVLAPTSGAAVMLCAPLLQFIGKISYSLYLVHPFALFPLQALGSYLARHGCSLWLVWGGFIVFGLAASLVAATISYELIEVRLRRWLNDAVSRFMKRGDERIDQQA